MVSFHYHLIHPATTAAPPRITKAPTAFRDTLVIFSPLSHKFSPPFLFRGKFCHSLSGPSQELSHSFVVHGCVPAPAQMRSHRASYILVPTPHAAAAARPWADWRLVMALGCCWDCHYEDFRGPHTGTLSHPLADTAYRDTGPAGACSPPRKSSPRRGRGGSCACSWASCAACLVRSVRRQWG